MIDDQRRISPSRRQFLGAAAGAAIAVAAAGCLGSLTNGDSSTLIEPTEPTEPREGSPGEFYYFLESNGIEVDELAREDDDLYLTYSSEAETVEESDGEIRTIYEVYKQALIHRGSEIEFLYSEISNPFDEQALGWGINSEWIHRFDSAEMAENKNESDPLEDDDPVENESASDDGERNESITDELDMGLVTVWSNIMNSKVYEEDLEGSDDDEAVEDADELESENETASDD